MNTIRSLSVGLLAFPLLACPGDDTNSSNSTGPGTTTTATATDTAATTVPNTATDTSGSSDTASAPTTAADTTTGDGSSGSTAADGSSSGSTGATSTGALADLPDLDMSLVSEDTIASVIIQTSNFNANSCAFLNGCLGGTGQRRLLRFATITPNVGTADFYVGNQTDNPELFVEDACDGGWLFEDYARYRLLDGEGNEVGVGHKSAFALIDLVPWYDNPGPAQYGFGDDMGISVGWSDVYDSGLQCQWVDITGVPAGDYTLELDINPDQVVEEQTFDNNILQIPVTITD